MTELPQKVKDFIGRAQLELLAKNVKVRMPETALLDLGDGNPCKGYFTDTDDAGEPEFAVAIGDPWEEWFPIFLHEFCHFQQWRDRRAWWDNLTFDGQDGLDLVLEHFAGTRTLTPTQIVRYCLVSASCEADCEARVIDLIDGEGFDIDREEYAKKANSYITFYYALPELKSWCTGERPYMVPEILEMMPTSLRLSDLEYWGLAEKAMPLYKKHCVK